MKNAFYFMLKALFVFKIFLHFGCVEKRLDEKTQVKSAIKFMASQTGQQIIAIHMLLNILRSKGNQRLKFGQLLEYKIRNFFEKLYRQCGGEASPRPFYKKS